MEIYLTAEDLLTICVHGTEHNMVEDLFSDDQDDRTIKLDGDPIDYHEDMVKADPPRRRRVAREIFSMMWKTFRDSCVPLGRICINRPALLFTNPDPLVEKAVVLKENEELAEVVECTDKTGDYNLHYSVVVNEQPLKYG